MSQQTFIHNQVKNNINALFLSIFETTYEKCTLKNMMKNINTDLDQKIKYKIQFFIKKVANDYINKTDIDELKMAIYSMRFFSTIFFKFIISFVELNLLLLQMELNKQLILK